jgi:PIN domain nuclease of toxin-antitoxin system
MIVLDTHIWVWLVSSPELLSESALTAISKGMSEQTLLISTISTWEVALLVRKKRLELTMDVSDWVLKSERLPFFRFVPVDNVIAIRSVNLPEPLHSDPADRIIISTAIGEGADLVTKDTKLINYPHVKTIC